MDVEAKADHRTPGDVRKILASLDVKKGTSNLTVTFDGKTIGPDVIRYEESPIFAVALPKHNIFGTPAGVYDPRADNGYYALIRGLLQESKRSNSWAHIPDRFSHSL
ncbi:hypothetical protein QFZ23_001526 [Arthrobacter globiformis]|uniref:hypothetical protein n=1 Tax=Arthrobacter globiformis TaxID=1665 RepID=UPI0027878C10|nr:hypothetical protein [Arthrobacter globiformis]MDQ1057625.1 hypothetical protein [Arthrobacter globiformis]